jgi:hypothetical protein
MHNNIVFHIVYKQQNWKSYYDLNVGKHFNAEKRIGLNAIASSSFQNVFLIMWNISHDFDTDWGLLSDAKSRHLLGQ